MTDFPLLPVTTRMRAGVFASLATLALLGAMVGALAGPTAPPAPPVPDEPRPGLVARADMYLVAQAPALRAMVSDQSIEYSAAVCRPLSRCMR